MSISFLFKVQLSLEQGLSASGTERLISESCGGFHCIGSCVDGGGCVSRSMWKASLFQRSSLVWERGLKTDLNTALWLGTLQKAALSNHTPNFDWHINSARARSLNEGFSFSSPQVKHKEPIVLLELFLWYQTPDNAACEPGPLRWHPIYRPGSFSLPCHLNGNARRMSFSKLYT